MQLSIEELFLAAISVQLSIAEVEISVHGAQEVSSGTPGMPCVGEGGEQIVYTHQPLHCTVNSKQCALATHKFNTWLEFRERVCVEYMMPAPVKIQFWSYRTLKQYALVYCLLCSLN